jgi:hypothetical protein
MNRDEAVNLLKEILDTCVDLKQNGVALMPPNADDVLSKDYQIHIMGDVSKVDLSCLNQIVEKSRLSLKMFQEKMLLVIYRPIMIPLSAR